jgi:hypothetical protein
MVFLEENWVNFTEKAKNKKRQIRKKASNLTKNG